MHSDETDTTYGFEDEGLEDDGDALASDTGDVQTVLIPISEICGREDNPNAMEPERYAALVSLIRRYGFLEPCLVRPLDPEDPRYEQGYRYEMVQGHHRMRALVDLGATELPCIVRDFGDDEARALQLGMNRVRGELDLNAVARDLDLLTQQDWPIEDLVMLGFTESELDHMLAFARETDSEIGLVIDGAVALPEEGPVKQKTRWVLEIEFRTKEELVSVRKALNSINRDHGLALHAILGFAEDARRS